MSGGDAQAVRVSPIASRPKYDARILCTASILGRMCSPIVAGFNGDTFLGPSSFRLKYLDPYADAARTWLHREAEVVDTTHLTPAQAALRIAEAVRSGRGR
ncbi:MAG: ATP-binding protein [Amycolatopsis sp.]|nr:ATP-binding protein [Amycolatopsis sp.]